MRSHTGKRSRPKAEIEPIRVGELLKGAGMRGFLSVLEPPVAVPHLRQLGARPPMFASPELVEWVSARAQALLERLGGQADSLAAIAEMARRTNGSAERLTRAAERIRSRTIHHAAGLAACEAKGESFMKKAGAARALRTGAPEAGWQEWISESAVARTAQGLKKTTRTENGAYSDPPSLYEEIARLAYEHWQQRGCPTGSPEVDWFHAEKQLLK